MSKTPKIFGIGMSKTGTTTLAHCLGILGFTPHASFNLTLKKWVENGKDIEYILSIAENYQSFEDSPWYLIYRDLDRRFPGSKFILTIRKDSLTHANSSWSHGVRRGLRSGKPSAQYLAEKIQIYERHNQEVQDYFRERPNDLLILCWENGDGWEKLCGFLNCPVPALPIPHSNRGRSFPSFISESSFYRAMARAVHRIWGWPVVQRTKAALRDGIKFLRQRAHST